MRSVPVAIGAACCAVAVVAGAFGAHLLEGRLGEREAELWDLAVRYLLVSGFGQVLAGLASRTTSSRDKSFTRSAYALLAGGGVFSGTLGAMALGAPRWLGAVTPVGGLLLILGFLLFAWTAWRG